jgi:hypothetical protein
VVIVAIHGEIPLTIEDDIAIDLYRGFGRDDGWPVASKGMWAATYGDRVSDALLGAGPDIEVDPAGAAGATRASEPSDASPSSAATRACRVPAAREKAETDENR